MDFWAPLPLVCILCKQVPFCVDLISFSPRTFRCFTNLHLWTHWSAKFERLFSLQHVFSIRQNHPKTSNIYFPSPEVGYQEFCELSGISYDVKVMWKCDEIKHGGKPEEHTWRPPLFLQAGSHHSWKFHFYVKCQSLYRTQCLFKLVPQEKQSDSQAGLFAWNFHWKMFKTCLCDPSSVRSSRNQGAKAVARSREVVKA